MSGHNDDTFGPLRQRPYPMPGLPAAIGDRLMGQRASDIGHLPYAEGAGHIMGTTRMGEDPGTLVANTNGQSHDHSNLWFAGSSLFPTSGTANPTLTIAALALRSAELIKIAMRQ